MKKLYPALLLFLPLLFACEKKQSLIPDPESYYAELDVWKANRLERLKSRNGWLNLAGLYWLDEGQNTFGSDSSNHIVFPSGAAAFCGTISLKEGVCSLEARPEAGAMVDSLPVSRIELRNDQSGTPTKVEMGTLSWYIIKRDTLYGIRLRDYEHPVLGTFHEIPAYPPDTKWVVQADYHPFDSSRIISVPTAIGTFEDYKCPGELRFRVHGKIQTILPFSEGRNFFIIFSDATSGKTTYGAGRYLTAGLPDSSAHVLLDFNRATSPPCAFTPFATCPMPPRENMLDVAIEAGEKFAGH